MQLFIELWTLMNRLIKQATIIDSKSAFHLQTKDIYVSNNLIIKIADNIYEKELSNIDEIINKDLKTIYISTGWIDTHSYVGEPGYEHKETFETLSAAAEAGGYTTLLVLPNTNPSISNAAMVKSVQQLANNVATTIHFIGSVTQKNEGKVLAEMMDMQAQNAIAFSDGLKPIQDGNLMYKALQYVNSFEGVIIQIPIEESMTAHGLMHEGITSTKLGLQGMPEIAEHIIIQRDIALAAYAKSKLHISGISTAKSVVIIAAAKAAGVQVTCSVTPQHLLFTDDNLKPYDSTFKINPPLRTAADVTALIDGINNGTIDCIATHHHAHEWDSKQKEFAYTAYGMIGLETTIHTLSLLQDKIQLPTLIKCLTTNAANIFNLENNLIAENSKGALTVFDFNIGKEYTTGNKKSKGINSPFLNTTLQGNILATIN